LSYTRTRSLCSETRAKLKDRKVRTNPILFGNVDQSAEVHHSSLSAKHRVINGEMVALREDGTCDFGALQKGARASISARVTYFPFDLLYQDAEDLRRLPLF